MLNRKEGGFPKAYIWSNIDFEAVKQRIDVITAELEKALNQYDSQREFKVVKQRIDRITAQVEQVLPQYDNQSDFGDQTQGKEL